MTKTLPGTLTVVIAGFLTAMLQSGSQANAAGAELDGQELFQTYCASCHGTTGVGNGPAAGALRQRPANPTTYTVANGGTFPTVKLHRVIDGRDVMAHGSSEMPVWGNAFKISHDGLTEDSVTARIDAIVRYLESIQIRRGQ